MKYKNQSMLSALFISALTMSSNGSYAASHTHEGHQNDLYKTCMIMQPTNGNKPSLPFAANELLNLSADQDNEFLLRFGFADFGDSTLQVKSQFSLPAPAVIDVPAEDDGSIPLARPINLTDGEAVVINGVIGDGLFGSSGEGTGDFDFFLLEGLKQGQELSVSTRPVDGNQGSYTMAIYDAQGNVVRQLGSFQNTITTVEIPADGDYYFSMGGENSGVRQTDPFDSSSGLIRFGGLGEVSYFLRLGLNYSQEKTYSFIATPGTVIAGALGETVFEKELSVVDPDGTVRINSTRQLEFPAAIAPYPQGPVQAVHVVDQFGFYEVKVKSFDSEPFELNLLATRAPINKERGVQTIFLDFDGADVDNAVFQVDNNTVERAPGLAPFLAGWNIAADQEDELIDIIVKQVRRKLIGDARRSELNPNFKLRLRNSKDHRDVWGEKNVSRVVIGANSDQLAIPFFLVAIAQSIDIGNFDTQETAVVSLDLIGGDSFFNNFNDTQAAEGQRLQLVGEGIANIVLHEIGHFLGNYHTSETADVISLMDGSNGFYPSRVAGEDRIFGTEDDKKVAFKQTEFSQTERFFKGQQNALGNVAWSSSRPSFPFNRSVQRSSSVSIVTSSSSSSSTSSTVLNTSESNTAEDK